LSALEFTVLQEEEKKWYYCPYYNNNNEMHCGVLSFHNKHLGRTQVSTNHKGRGEGSFATLR